MNKQVSGGVILRINIDPLRKRLAVSKNEVVSVAYVSRKTGLHYDTVKYLQTNRRFDMKTLERLIEFFNEEGLPITAGDLFEEVPTNGHESEQ